VTEHEAETETETVTELVARATYRGAVSDDHYGTEAAEITLEQSVPEGTPASEVAEQLLGEAKALVHKQLALSTSSDVRRAVAARAPAVAAVVPADDEDDEDLPY